MQTRLALLENAQQILLKKNKKNHNNEKAKWKNPNNENQKAKTKQKKSAKLTSIKPYTRKTPIGKL